MPGPPLCDPCVIKYDSIVPICPIFPVPLQMNSVDSGLLPRFDPLFSCSSPPCLNGVCNYSEFTLPHDNKTLNAVMTHFKWYFICACLIPLHQHFKCMQLSESKQYLFLYGNTSKYLINNAPIPMPYGMCSIDLFLSNHTLSHMIVKFTPMYPVWIEHVLESVNKSPRVRGFDPI